MTTPSRSRPEPNAGRRRRVAPYIVGGVAIVVVRAVHRAAHRRHRPPGESADSPLIGNVAPDANGVLDDGSPFELSRRKGSWVVLNFFTHNCVPCIREHPELIQFVKQQRALGNDGAELYTIVRDSTVIRSTSSSPSAAATGRSCTTPSTSSATTSVSPLVPETWIIDPSGVVRARIITQVTADGLGRADQRVARSGAMSGSTWNTLSQALAGLARPAVRRRRAAGRRRHA